MYNLNVVFPTENYLTHLYRYGNIIHTLLENILLDMYLFGMILGFAREIWKLKNKCICM